MKKLLGALLALCILSFGFVLAVLIAPGSNESQRAPAEADGAGAEALGIEAEPQEVVTAEEGPEIAVELVGAAMPDTERGVRRAVVEEESSARQFGDWGDRETRVVSGRVLLPADVPFDPSLRVLALETDMSRSQLLGGSGVLTHLRSLNSNRPIHSPGLHSESDAMPELEEPVPQEREEEDESDEAATSPGPTDLATAPRVAHPVTELTTIPGLLAVAPVAADGSFELPFPAVEDGPTGWIIVDGRYLYSKEATPVPQSPAAGVEIEPEVGAWLTGEVRVPADATQPEKILWDVTVRLRIDPTRFASLGIGSASEMGPLDSRSTVLGGPHVDTRNRFEFRGVDPNPTYVIRVRCADLASSTQGNILIESGESQHFEFDLLRGARIQGRVVGDEGEGVAEARVRAASGSFFGFAIHPGASTETDAEGWFELTHVTPGEVQLYTRKTGHLAPGPADLTLKDGQDLEGVVLELSAGNKVGGVVLLPDGAPAIGAEVELEFDPAAYSSMAAFNAARGASGSAVTDEQGSFVIAGLGRGPFSLTAELEVGDGQLAARLSGVKPGSLDLELVLRPDATVRGVVLTPQGDPLEAFTVRAELDSLAVWSDAETLESDFEDADGAFELSGLHAGLWKVRASAEGWSTSEPLTVEIPLADDLALLEFVLEAEARASGLVLDPDGQPIADAIVTKELNMQEMLANVTGRTEVGEARTDEGGNFVLGGFSTGTVSLIARHASHVESAPFPVELRSGLTTEEVLLQLRRGGVITGEVFGEQGEPAGGVTVFMQEMTNYLPIMMQTEPDGTFHRKGVKPGSWQVSAMLDSKGARNLFTGGTEEPDIGAFLSGMRMITAEIKEGEETHVVLGAPPANPVNLRGRVTHVGEPVPKALVTALPDGAMNIGALKFTQTDETGAFEITLDQTGAMLVQVQLMALGGMSQNTMEFPQLIPEGVEEHVIEIELPTGRISGRVTGPDGTSAAGARISLGLDGGVAYGSLTGGRYVELQADEDGHFDIEHLDPGTYAVFAGGVLGGGAFGGRTEEGREVRTGVQILEGDWIRDLDFRLRRAGTIKGQVLDVTGGPVAHAAIFVRDESGNALERFSMIASDSSGHFSYTGLSPGRYTVSARTTDLASLEARTLEVREDAVSETTLQVDAGTILSISVNDKTGKQVRAKILVRNSSGHQVNGLLALSEIMGGGASFYDTKAQRVGPLPAGRYTVTALAADGRAVTKPVTLSGQAERKLKIRLK